MPAVSPGVAVLHDTFAGYRHAWTHRRRLLPVLLPLVALRLAAAVAADLLQTSDRMTVLNGGLVVTPSDGPWSWLPAALSVGWWLLTLTAGAATAVGALRGRAVDPLRAATLAGRHFPVLALGLVVNAGLAIGALWLAAGLAGAAGGWFGVTLVVGTVAALAVVAARLLLAVVSRVFGATAWELTRGRVLVTTAPILLGGFGLPVLGAYLTGRVRTGASRPLLADALDAVLLIVVVAGQSALLAYLYLRRRAETGTDLDAVDARLGRLAGARPAWGWLGGAAAIVPLAMSTVVGAANPYAVPTVRTGDALIGAVAAAWPAGQHPVVVTTGGVRYCDTDLCDRYVGQTGGPPMVDGWSSTTISPDGTVVTAATTGGKDTGGPFIEYGRCTRAGCGHEWVPIRASTREPAGWPSVAGAAAPDGAVWFAVAMTLDEDKPGPKASTISFLRCAGFPCGKPERHVIGTVQRPENDGVMDSRLVRVTMGTDGRPVATFHIAQRLHVVTCEPVTCANPQSTDIPSPDARPTGAEPADGDPAGNDPAGNDPAGNDPAGNDPAGNDTGDTATNGDDMAGSGTADAHTARPVDTLWTPPAGLREPTIALAGGELRIGEARIPLTDRVAEGTGGLAVVGSDVYATAAVSTAEPPTGFWVTAGTPPRSWQQLVWRCEAQRCAEPQRIRLPAAPRQSGYATHAVLAVSPEGRVLIVRDDCTILLSAPADPA